MRPQPVHPTDTPLPRPPAGAGDRPHAVEWSVTSAQVADFDALLHEVHPDARRVTVDELSRLGQWLLSLPEPEARLVLNERITRIEELRAMLDDPDWDSDPASRARVRKLLRYLDQGDDLIPDRIPLLGLLDDVLLLELAWPAVSTEAEEYRDFCAYRRSEHPVGAGAQLRAAWVRDRLAELALWRHELEASRHQYVEGGHPDRPFRIS